MLAPDDGPESEANGDADNRGGAASPAPQRKIIHINMDAFYASRQLAYAARFFLGDQIL